MVPAALKVRLFQAKGLDDRRQPGTILQTGAWSIKIIIAFCSLRREERQYKARLNDGGDWFWECKVLQTFYVIAKSGSCSWHTPFWPGGRMLSPPRMRLSERSLRQDKSSKTWDILCFPATISQRTIYSLQFLHAHLCGTTSYFSICFRGLRGHLPLTFSFLSLVSRSPEDGPLAHQWSLKIARN